MSELTPTIPDLNSVQESISNSTNSDNSNSPQLNSELNSEKPKSKRGGARKGAGRPKGSKKKEMSREDLILILEKQIQDPSTSPRDRNSSIRKLSLLRKWERPYARTVAQQQPPEPKPLAPPPQPDDSTPEEVEVYARCSAKWDEWSKQHPQESRDFSIADLYERHNMFGPEKWAEMRAAGEPIWRACWAEYDAYYRQQTGESFFGSK